MDPGQQVVVVVGGVETPASTTIYATDGTVYTLPGEYTHLRYFIYIVYENMNYGVYNKVICSCHLW